jgi:hypothetical protein
MNIATSLLSLSFFIMVMQYALTCYQSSTCHSQATSLGVTILKQQKLDKIGIRQKLTLATKAKECLWIPRKSKNKVKLISPSKLTTHKVHMNLTGKLNNE